MSIAVFANFKFVAFVSHQYQGLGANVTII